MSNYPSAPRQVIDRYHLLELLGEGGMGEVWLAEQREPMTRRVAFKIIKLGMATAEVIARFEAERQALAVMDHPNIAQIYDGGTTDSGLPYFVMELVSGVPITEYADTHRLRTRDRIRLFLPVCRAVQHAHGKGVIHRDLKPSNVLVSVKDGDPIVKIIDFGIAKAVGMDLTDKTLHTRVGQLVGTPAYMSPEQAEMSGLDIDARSDVYSLGAMLYELLVGVAPLEGLKEGYLPVVIRESKIVEPSARLSLIRERDTLAMYRGVTLAELSKELRGDLDWIVLKATAKDRTDRFASARELEIELERFLREEPITLAGPATRVRRMIRGAATRLERRTDGTISRTVRPWVWGAAGLVGLGVIWGGMQFVPPGSDTSGPVPSGGPPEFRKVTSSGRVVAGEISPDGSTIAYVETDPQEPERLLVQDLSGGRPLEIATAASIETVRWSPDGSRILTFVIEADGTNATYVIPRFGGTRQLVSNSPTYSDTWSSDGGRVASVSIPNALNIADLASGEFLDVPIDIEPALTGVAAWRPDHEQVVAIARTMDKARQSLWLLSTDGAQRIPLLEDSLPIVSVRWASAERLLYLRGGGDTKELWGLDVGPTGERRGRPQLLQAGLGIAASATDVAQHFSLTRDGSTLLYVDLEPASNLWHVEVSREGDTLTFEERRLTDGTSLLATPEFSPDGSRLVFSRGDGNQADVVVSGSDAARPRQLTFLEGYANSPVWSPDGEEIAFVLMRESGAEAWLAPVDGGTPRKLADGASTLRWSTTTWAPGARLLYQTEPWTNLAILDPATGQSDLLVSSDTLGWVHWPRYDPQGHRLVYYLFREPGDPLGGIWLTEPGEGDGRLVLNGEFLSPISWTSDGEAIWIWTIVTSRLALVSLDGEILASGTLPVSPPTALTVNPLDQTLVVVVPEPRGDLWTLRNFDPNS